MPHDAEAAITLMLQGLSDEQLGKMKALLIRMDDPTTPLTDEEVDWLDAVSGGLAVFLSK